MLKDRPEYRKECLKNIPSLEEMLAQEVGEVLAKKFMEEREIQISSVRRYNDRDYKTYLEEQDGRDNAWATTYNYENDSR